MVIKYAILEDTFLFTLPNNVNWGNINNHHTDISLIFNCDQKQEIYEKIMHIFLKFVLHNESTKVIFFNILFFLKCVAIVVIYSQNIYDGCQLLNNL